MSKIQLGKEQSHDRNLQGRMQSRQNKSSSTKFKFNRQNAIRRSHYQFGQRYQFLQKIGEGSFGQVYKVMHKQLKTIRALKIVKKTSLGTSSHNPYEQLQILKKLDHPNVLKIYEYFQTDAQWLIITQYFEGRELFDQIICEKRLTQRKAALIFAQICKAVAYIHANSIVHRDIKPQNILVRRQNYQRTKSADKIGQHQQFQYSIKLIDWGLGSKCIKDLIKKCGTPQYCAPEVLQGSYGYQCDLWSLGVLLYVMLAGRFPFKGRNVQQTLSLVGKGFLTFKSPQWVQISIQAKYLISKLIVKKPSQRLRAAQILKSQWIIHYQQEQKSYKSLEQLRQDEKSLEQTLMRLKQFTIDNKFQAVVINFIHNYIQSQQKQKSLKRQFELLDENKDGVLCYEELLKGYKKIYNYLDDFTLEKIVLQIFKNIDLDGSNKIQYSQFITFATKIDKKFCEKQLKQVFNLLDEDGNGTINKKQIRQILMYEKGSQSQQFDRIIDQIDLDRDGSISLQQFIGNINQAVKKVIKKAKQQQIKKSKQRLLDKNSHSKNSQQSEISQIRITRLSLRKGSKQKNQDFINKQQQNSLSLKAQKQQEIKNKTSSKQNQNSRLSSNSLNKASRNSHTRSNPSKEKLQTKSNNVQKNNKVSKPKSQSRKDKRSRNKNRV